MTAAFDRPEIESSRSMMAGSLEPKVSTWPEGGAAMKAKGVAIAMMASLSLIGGGAATTVLLRPQSTSAGAAAQISGTEADRGVAPSMPSRFGRIAAAGRVEPIGGVIELAIGEIGALKGVYVDAGDAIHRGQLLAELDNADQQARVAAANAQVRLREAELLELEHGARPEERRESAAELDQSAAELALAKREFDRRAPLVQSGVASREAMDQARSALDVAAAKHAASEAAVNLINAPPRAEDVEIARANLALARAALDEQRALLDKTQLRSPIDGIVLRRYLRAGEAISIQPPTPILEIGNIDGLRVRAEIDEADIAHIRLGQRAWISAEAYRGQRFGGVVAKINPRAGRKTVFTDDPADRRDTKIVEALINLDAGVHLPVGLRVDVILEPPSFAAK
jgi:HlyD family secretion protein